MFGYALKEIFQSLLLAARASPRHLVRIILLNLLAGTGPAVVLYLQKIIIDEIVAGANLPGNGFLDWMGERQLLWIGIAGFVLVQLLLDSVETIANFEIDTFRESVVGSTKARIFEKIAEFKDISLFESPDLLNTVQLATSGIPRMSFLSNIAGNLIVGTLGFIPIFLLSFAIAWWVPIVIIIFAAPSIVVQIRFEEESWGVERAQAGTVRNMGISESVLTQPQYAKELRLFQLQSFFLDRWRSLFSETLDETLRIRKKGTRVILLWSLVGGLGVGGPFIYIVWATINGLYTLGDLALYAGIVFQVRKSLYILGSNIASLHDVALGTAPIHQLLRLRASMQDSAVPPPDIGMGPGIEIESLSFSYPEGGRPVLKNVSLAVRPGETLAIVGKNGAGKSTLVKLLCRLYDPQEGSILWSGSDLRSLDLEALRQNIAVVMQDFAQFPTTARENIGFGQLERMDDEGAIVGAAESAGLASVLDSLPDNLDTPLTKQLPNGTELSSGQWQRFALARALFRRPQASLLILDEPTAALDPDIEYEFYRLFREMARDKTAVFISHRLALARTADRIAVLDDGELAEIGAHEELMQKGGLYSRMFTLQASGYYEE